MVEKAMVWCGSKCTGATWERRRKVPPRLPLWAAAPEGAPIPAAPTARAAPPSLSTSRRVRELAECWSMVVSLWRGLPIEPGRGHAAAPVVPEIRCVVLQRAVPDPDVVAGRHVYVPLLLGEEALHVEQ